MANESESDSKCTGRVIGLGILAIFFPPLVAAIERGCGIDLLINIIFTIIGWIPGVIHAWFLLYMGPPAPAETATSATVPASGPATAPTSTPTPTGMPASTAAPASTPAAPANV